MQKRVTKNELTEYAASLATNLPSKGFALFLLSGTLGTGKTTFAKAFLQALGIKEHIPSPTYTLGNTYDLPEHTAYHLDLYRLDNLDDYYHLGFHDILSQHYGIWLIEWPELILPELAGIPYTHITLTMDGEDARLLTVTPGNEATDQTQTPMQK